MYGTSKGALYLNASNIITSSSAMTNGQILIGSTSGLPAAATITGTTNQVNVTNGSNSITLALPQNINTAATPTFAGGFITGTLLVGKSSPAITTGANILQLYGTNASGSGPHIQTFTSADNYPILQQLNWSHNNVSINFDCYFDTAWRSSSATSNFQINKLNDIFSINYYPGATQGTSISSILSNQALSVNTSGLVTIGSLSSTSLSATTINAGTEFISGSLVVGKSSAIATDYNKLIIWG